MPLSIFSTAIKATSDEPQPQHFLRWVDGRGVWLLHWACESYFTFPSAVGWSIAELPSHSPGNSNRNKTETNPVLVFGRTVRATPWSFPRSRVRSLLPEHTGKRLYTREGLPIEEEGFGLNLSWVYCLSNSPPNQILEARQLWPGVRTFKATGIFPIRPHACYVARLLLFSSDSEAAVRQSHNLLMDPPARKDCQLISKRFRPNASLPSSSSISEHLFVGFWSFLRALAILMEVAYPSQFSLGISWAAKHG